MAEHLGQKKPPKIKSPPDQGFGAMGKSIPLTRKIDADAHLKDMGLTDIEDRFHCIALVSGRLERDDPYGAIHDAMKYIDLTGAYRLLAVLLCDPVEKQEESQHGRPEHTRRRRPARNVRRSK